MASLNIKNQETVGLIKELSQRTGQTMTGAVTLAVKAQLERSQPNPKAGLAEWLMQVSRETSAMMNDSRTSKELMDELYDPETGLPI
ncbi:MAG TPA: type II toxin-antitoxin system VapB family antitoxin [Acidobacteriaceae bacterium]|jgi:antitoxin VapB|nr:type II toxin-antitoxin system VapB family antitoxin [Acidobacteriaceae bacterium]